MARASSGGLGSRFGFRDHDRRTFCLAQRRLCGLIPLMRGRGLNGFRCTRHFEAHLRRQGWRLVAGCDEVGRGALIGPVYAAAVILDPAKRIRGVDDSKKLTAEARVELDAEIRAQALACQVVSISAAEVDALNVYQASRLAM